MARTLCRCMTYYRVQMAIKRVTGKRSVAAASAPGAEVVA